MANTCKVCRKEEGGDVKLLRCGACKNINDTWYCSEECQKANWKEHKKQCKFVATAVNIDVATGPSTGVTSSIPDHEWNNGKGLQLKVNKPLTRLQNRNWLHDRPETDTYKLLIDSFRMRQEDSYKYEGNVETGTIYAGETTSMPAFKSFLKEAKKKSGLLPPWWNAEKQVECEALGADNSKTNWVNLCCCIEKHDIVDHYGDPTMPMQLRMFAEQVYGRGLGNQSGETMLQLQVQLEKGNINAA